jgi:RHS repeat-associated protein
MVTKNRKKEEKMKKIIVLIVALFFELFGSGPDTDVQQTVFGPKKYVRTIASSDYFTENFQAFRNDGQISIFYLYDPSQDHFEGGFAGARVTVNDRDIIDPQDSEYNEHFLQKTIPLLDMNTLSIDLEGPPGGFIIIEVMSLAPEPSISISAAPDKIKAGQPVTLSWNSNAMDALTIEPGIGNVDPYGELVIHPVESTTYTISGVGTDGKVIRQSVFVDVEAQSGPWVRLTAQPAVIEPGQGVLLAWTSSNAESLYMDNAVGEIALAGSLTVYPDHSTTFRVTATGPFGSSGSQTRVTVAAAPDPQPEGSFGKQYQDQIPEDAALAAYAPERFSMITGVVHDVDGNPLELVAVTILNHPRYGTARTDLHGRYSIPVEGGGSLVAVFSKPDYLEVHRRVSVPWNDVAQAAPVNMITVDQAHTVAVFNGDPHTVISHRSSEVSDQWGTRACTLTMTSDNRAFAVDKAGRDVQELEAITVRATEYATLRSMPAELPPSSAYTYCAEFSVDGARRVRFEKPVIAWVNNFLGFEVGEIVPSGSYDRDKGVWVPIDNGRVVKLLDTNNDGISDSLDADGDGLADDLNSDGAYADELAGLDDAALYAPGMTFWRMPLNHFSPKDFNMPFGTPRDAERPNAAGIVAADRQLPGAEDCKRSNGSFVEERSRIMHEDIPIAGTDLKLYYTSNRVDGYQTRVTVPASGPAIPQSLKRIEIKLSIAGNTQKKEFEPIPNLVAEFYWDGTDYRGRELSTPIRAHVSVGYVYDAVFYRAGDFERAFAQPGLVATEIPARQEIALWEQSDMMVHPPRCRTSHDVAQGWTLSLQHHLNPQDLSILHKGDGTTSANNVQTITTVAGSGLGRYGGTNKPAVMTSLFYPMDVAVDAENNFYIADRTNYRILKVDAGGFLTDLAGNGTKGYGGDGGQAVEASLSEVYSLAVCNDGDIFMADTNNSRIRKVDKAGIISTVAGTGEHGFSGDNGPATQAMLYSPKGIACDDQGYLYIADSSNHRIRKVDPAGIITTIAGNGIDGFSGDNGPAVQASLRHPWALALRDDGTLYFVDRANHRVRKVDVQGIITTVAGAGTQGYNGDGIPAELARLHTPADVALDRAGNLYISDEQNQRIRRISKNGMITTVAGSGTYDDFPRHPVPATHSPFRLPMGIDIDNNGSIYIADNRNHIIRKVSHPGAFINTILEEDGIVFTDPVGMAYVAASDGTHMKTLELDSGMALHSFEYDDDGYLAAVVDRFGRRTVITRDEKKRPLTITSPYGLVTSLVVDANNFLSEIVNPDGSRLVFEYDPQGRLTAKIEPTGHRFEHDYDPYGRLSLVRDEAGGSWIYALTTDADGTSHVAVTTAEGNVTSYLDHTDFAGTYTSVITGPDESETRFSRSADGLQVDKSLSCGSQVRFQYDLDPEFNFPFIRETRRVSAQGLEKVSGRRTVYTDRDGDNVPDIITRTSVLNDKTAFMENDRTQAIITQTSPAGRATSIHYNPDNLLAERVHIQGLLDLNYLYDDHGRLTSAAVGSRETLYTYNHQGNTASIRFSGDSPTRFSYDTVGRPIRIERPDSALIEFAYDENGNLVCLSTPSNVDHEFTYSTVNKPNAYLTPLSGTYQYVYDRDRRMTGMVFPSGKQISYVYGSGLLRKILTPEKDIDISYACSRKIDIITDGTNAIEYTYDGELYRGETTSGTLNAAISLRYNSDYLPDQLTYAGKTSELNYDPDGLLTNAGQYAILRNDDNGLPESVFDTALTLNRSFDGYGEIADQSVSIADQNISAWQLQRDNRGRIVQKAETMEGVASVYAYEYDTVGRLLSVTENNILVEKYEYDDAGSRSFDMNTRRGIAARNFTYSAEDHLLMAGETTFGYDLDGFLVSKTDAAGTTQYRYSSQGELMRVYLPDGPTIEYVHDPLGRRIAKKINGAIQEKYLWQGQTRLLAVFDENDHVLARFEYADERVPMSLTSAGETYYLTYDPTGSLRLVADEAGNVIKRIDYDAYGNIIADSNPDVNVWLGFAAGLHDRDIDLVRFGHRDYDPKTGRWTAKDPIFFNGGDTDLYGYCLNDPVNGFDPDGLEGWDLITATKYLHNQGAARLQPGYEAAYGEIPKWVGSIGNMFFDQAAQITAEHLTSKYISQTAGSALKKVNFLLGIFDPFPQTVEAPTLSINSDHTPCD